MRNKIALLFLTGPLLVANTTWAGAKPATSVPTSYQYTQPPRHHYFNYRDITFSGYVDGSYNYLQNKNTFVSGVFDRVFDIAPNGFTLQQLAFTLAYQPDYGLGFVFNPVLGRDANTLAPYGWDPYFGSQTFGVDPLQVYLQYKWKCLTVIAGIYNKLAGAETTDPTTDINFSRSILFGYAQPFTVMGIRGTYTLNDTLNFIAGVNNGWDSIRDTSRRKTLEFGISYRPYPVLYVTASFYSGGERVADRIATGPQSIRDLLDIVAVYKATPKLTLAANYDYANQTFAFLPGGTIASAVWQGIAGYANYAINDKWRIAARGEFFADRNGFRTGVVQNWKELTLTLGYNPIRCVELRLETRRDFSNVQAFMHKGTDGETAGLINTQQSYALEAFYKFA
jgi:hypothetical protein